MYAMNLMRKKIHKTNILSDDGDSFRSEKNCVSTQNGKAKSIKKSS